MRAQTRADAVKQLLQPAALPARDHSNQAGWSHQRQRAAAWPLQQHRPCWRPPAPPGHQAAAALLDRRWRGLAAADAAAVRSCRALCLPLPAASPPLPAASSAGGGCIGVDSILAGGLEGNPEPGVVASWTWDTTATTPGSGLPSRPPARMLSTPMQPPPALDAAGSGGEAAGSGRQSARHHLATWRAGWEAEGGRLREGEGAQLAARNR
jgi:hypothetical protein